jgi:hypothetical protein
MTMKPLLRHRCKTASNGEQEFVTNPFFYSDFWPSFFENSGVVVLSSPPRAQRRSLQSEPAARDTDSNQNADRKPTGHTRGNDI